MVKAVGGDRAAGIGTGVNGRCSRIQILKSVSKVHAMKGLGTDVSIGAGDHGQSGLVIIENGANVIQE